MRYTVRGLAPDHLLKTVEIDAADEAEATQIARRMGLFVSAIGPAQSLSFTPARHSRSPIQLVLFTQEMVALLDAGMSLIESVEALIEKESDTQLRSLLERVRTSLLEGKRFSAALAQQPQAFPPLYCSLVAASEQTGDLVAALRRFVGYRTRIDMIRSKLIGAAIYPLILLCVGSAITVFLIGFVVPKFAEVFTGSGRALPWVTQLMISVGSFTSRNMPWIMGGIVALSVLMVTGLRTGRLVAWGQGAVARVPGVGERMHVYSLSRLYMTMSMLLDGGIPIVAALQSAAPVLPQKLQLQLQQARISIENGEELSTAFEHHGLTTPISRRMLKIGERSGQLGTMLAQSAAFYEDEINRWVDRFSRAFEPILMAVIGLLVGGIVILLYMPIFDLANSI